MEFEKICDILCSQMNIEKEEITLDTRLTEDLGIDSLDMFIIMEEISQLFDIEISNDDSKNIKTIDDIVNYIKNTRR